jgi:hypothetical protein
MMTEEAFKKAKELLDGTNKEYTISELLTLTDLFIRYKG